MKHYVVVGCNISAYATIEVEANDQEEAEKKVEKTLSEYEKTAGPNEFLDGAVFDPCFDYMDQFRIVNL